MRTDYFEALDGKDSEQVNSACEDYPYPKLTERDRSYSDFLKTALPGDTGRVLGRAHAIGLTSLLYAPSLVPFYELQVVPVCPHCIERGHYTEDEALAWLPPLIDAGLVIPVLEAPLSKYPPRLAAVLSGAPRIPVFARHVLPDVRILASRGPSDEIPCSMCDRAAGCRKVGPVFEACSEMREKAWNDSDRAVAANVLNRALALGPQVSSSVGETLLSSASSQYDATVRAIDNLLNRTNTVLFAAAVNARAALSEPAITAHIQSEFALPVDPTRMTEDAESRLAIAEQLGIAFDPTVTAESYVAAVSQHAGALSRVFGEEWIRDEESGYESLSVAAAIAGEINESVRRVMHAEAKFKSLGAGFAGPIARTAIWTVVGSTVSPLLAACGVAKETVDSVTRAVKGKEGGPSLPLPVALQQAIEDTLGLAPTTLAVHGMRRAIKSARNERRP